MTLYNLNRYICDCNLNLKTAFIIIDKNVEPLNTIHAIDLLTNNIIKDKLTKQKLFLVCENSFELILCRTSITDAHFRHRYEFDNQISNWHLHWQLNFYQYIEKDIGIHRADILINDLIIEFQHSMIDIVDINSRYNNAIIHNKKLIWIIDCNLSIDVDEYVNIFIIEFKRDFWKYNHFLINTFIILNYNNYLFVINPNYVKSHITSTNKRLTVEEFINNIYLNDISFLELDDTIQCTLYHNQRGAGCGKTYESIQLLNTSPTKDIFIYLTKMHSAKEVIINELIEQYKRGVLIDIEIENEEDIFYNKQYNIYYYNKKLKKACQIIIGTIDSFMFTIGNKQTRDNDLFKGIVQSIQNNHLEILKDGSINYARNKIKLNKRCLIIIDEAQDLDSTYIKAIFTIMSNTYIDAYIIGDKLQSIWSNHNIHTYLEGISHNTKISSNIIIKKNTGINQVKRFHNKQFINLLNPIIDFEKYNLPHITHICDGRCKYKHDNDIKPFHIYQLPYININSLTDIEIKVDKIIENIVIKNMIIEIDKYNYLPKNFMFIFPILKSNYLANRLETRLQDFWIEKFNNTEYINNVLLTDDYWKNKLNNKYYKYVFLHKSEEGKAINLKESENATRLLSIHASKGQGCEVVFVLGINERELKMFSKEKNNLIYDSLLHVALTRQKKSLYVGIKCNGDDINNRFRDFGIIMDKEIKPRINDIKRNNKFSRLINYSIDHIFTQIDDLYIKPYNIEKYLQNNNDSTIIEWGHHLIRYYVFMYNLMYNIYNENTLEDDSIYSNQFITIINKVSKLSIIIKKYDDYYEYIEKKLCNINKITELPILEFSNNIYSRYTNILFDFCINIQKKIQNSLIKYKLPFLCPLETIILYHLIYLYNDGVHADITIMDIYSILYYYDECSNILNEEHNIYSCICKESFTTKTIYDIGSNDIHNSIKNHYEKTKIIKQLYNNYKEYLTENLEPSINFTYNINHVIRLNNDEDNFKFWSKLPIIGYSNKYVIHFIICATFNKLNFNDHIFNGIFTKYLIMNSTEKDIDRFDNKEIYTCILTLDSVEPIFINLNIKKDDLIFKECIRSFLIDEYSNKHNLIYDLYEYCNNKKTDNNNSLIYTYEMIKSYNNFDTIPLYILYCFYDMCIQLNTSKKNNYSSEYINSNILININTRKQFLKYINTYLEKAIEDFFTI